jgi:hypothetical protein
VCAYVYRHTHTHTHTIQYIPLCIHIFFEDRNILVSTVHRYRNIIYIYIYTHTHIHTYTHARSESSMSSRLRDDMTARIDTLSAELRKARMFAAAEEYYVDRRLVANVVVSYFDGMKVRIMYVYIYVHVGYTYIHTHIHVCMYVCMCIYIFMHSAAEEYYVDRHLVADIVVSYFDGMKV